MKKILTIALATALCVPCVIGLSGCNKNPQKPNVVAKDVYAMSAVTSATFLSGGANSVSPSKVMYQKAQETGASGGVVAGPVERPSEITLEHAQKIDTYLGMFSGMLADGFTQNSQAVDKATEQEEFKNYAVKLTVKVGATDYIMYYNEVNTETNEEVTDDGKESEVNTTLEGVMVFGEERYNLKGTREIETEVEGKETENEATITFKTSKRDMTAQNPNVFDEQNYVQVVQSFEDETENGKTEREVSYEYTIVENGNVVDKTEIEFENEDGKEELEIEYPTVEYVVSKVANQNAYKVALQTKNTKENDFLTITSKENGVNEFRYKNGCVENFKDGKLVEVKSEA